MIVIETGFISLSSLSIISTKGKAAIGLERILCDVRVKKKCLENMDRCTGLRDNRNNIEHGINPLPHNPDF